MIGLLSKISWGMVILAHGRISLRPHSHHHHHQHHARPFVGVFKSQSLRDLVNFWRYMPTKWLQQRQDGSKNDVEMPSRRAPRGTPPGVSCAALYRFTSRTRNHPPLGPYSRSMPRALRQSWGRGSSQPPPPPPPGGWRY